MAASTLDKPDGTPAGSAETISLPVEGMSCAACQVHVEQALRKTPGVEQATVNLMTHSAQVRLAAGGSAAALVAAIREAGYESRLPSPSGAIETASERELARTREESALKRRAVFSLCAGALLMAASMPLIKPSFAVRLVGAPGSHAFGPAGWAAHAVQWLFTLPPLPVEFAMLALTLFGMVWAGGSIYRRAWSAARHGTSNMHTLVALGTTAAFVYSTGATLAPSWFTRHGLRPEIYFDSVLLILGFLLLGNWLDARAKRRTLDALREFAALRPEQASVVRDGIEARVPAGEIARGETVVVRPGERLPVDGVVLEGASSIDESLVTGESEPALRGVGDQVIGGSLNYDGQLLYRATGVGAGSMLGQMIALMETAQASKAPMQQMADRVSRVFVPVVIAIAFITFVIWTIATHDPGRALGVSIAVLVIACPCAMGLAVPAALTVAIGRGAQMGVLFKGGEELERLAGVDTVIFDKTGTLTEGRPKVVNLHTAEGVSHAQLLGVAAALEAGSEHPLARAVLDCATERQVPSERATEVRARPGLGIVGLVRNLPAAAGNAALLAELGIGFPARTLAQGTTLHIALDGRWMGALTTQDTLRAGATQAVSALHRMGLATQMLTGDTLEASGLIATAVGVQAYAAGLLPADKLDRIVALQKQGRRVAMVGDGINDAAAISQADAGLAVGSGTDLARAAGDAILLRSEPDEVVKAIALARHTRRAMRQNLGWALSYNLLGIPLAAGVLYPATGLLLSPAVAGLAMALSSVSVLANSLRLRGYTPKVH